ncbi:TetR/AcrR family transcriptional regulator [Limosilactobacillus balticus]|uniref:TetR/AcrR family transcriptional regulator n=1 Tax=Limosilactobacillus balticus TaxID=2759747 RepID=A0ABS8RAC2_9LACO|nr:TetR/AcrR family transcriptional regulator [Limosilactobacillus balticus]MBB1128230.1 TetR/AcrR family transcriptional regulator [Limosilactobacillus balticus]MCD7132141.1 TetR/AcrR family transcriptional regulator [Limosilactobacillus balticus]MCD7137007.1 TetR/AcrR family transcriptional regulator [Limosilactobacillus balticus]MCD7137880.1 TetR/AcrR family transcriptional regulator [Limosilactobacillus balticus]
MDLRILKTKKNIKTTFLKLRQKYPLEKIKVITLCQQALINKSTFYRYYTDIYDLSNQMQQEIIDDIGKNFSKTKKSFTNIDDFIEELSQLKLKNPNIKILFNGQEERFIALAQKKVEQLYLNKEMEEKAKISITFLLGGLLFAYRGVIDQTYSESEFRKIASKAVKTFSDFIRE